MPELPEVETIRRQLESRLTGRVVEEAWSHPSGKFTPAREVVGAEFIGLGRRGKFLLAGLDDGRELVIHLGMTGRLGFRSEPDRPDNPHLRAWWRLDDPGKNSSDNAGDTTDGGGDVESALEFVDVRRFGRLRVVDEGDYRTIPTLAAAGPEPFDPEFDGREFQRLLGRSRRRIKTQLLSQRPVAGVGNIYADEALWIARINPHATRLGLERATNLLDAIRITLRQGIDNGGTTLRDYRNADGGAGENQHELSAYGRGGLPCRRCGDPLATTVIDARTTTYCRTCQRQ